MNKLDTLVQEGVLLSYQIVDLDDMGNLGKSNNRNSQKLTLTFPDGNILDISTWCSGCAENTGFSFE